MEHGSNGIASDLIEIAVAMGFDPTNAEDMAEFIKVYNENVTARRNSGPKPSSELSSDQPRARIDAAHQSEPPAPIGANLSREARKKFNRDRKKALEKRRRT